MQFVLHIGGNGIILALTEPATPIEEDQIVPQRCHTAGVLKTLCSTLNKFPDFRGPQTLNFRFVSTYWRSSVVHWEPFGGPHSGPWSAL